MHVGCALDFRFDVCIMHSDPTAVNTQAHTFMKKDSAISVRLPKPVKRAVVKEARDDHRSITSMVLKILTERYGIAQRQPAE